MLVLCVHSQITNKDYDKKKLKICKSNLFFFFFFSISFQYLDYFFLFYNFTIILTRLIVSLCVTFFLLLLLWFITESYDVFFCLWILVDHICIYLNDISLFHFLFCKMIMIIFFHQKSQWWFVGIDGWKHNNNYCLLFMMMRTTHLSIIHPH